MEKRVSKKIGVVLLLVAIIISITSTLGILNYVQSPRVVEAGAKELASSGEITLTIEKPLKTEDEGLGIASLNILPPGGQK